MRPGSPGARATRADAPVVTIGRTHPEFPQVLVQRLGPAAPDEIHLIGEPSLLSNPFVAWYSSGRLNPELIIPALELARDFRDGSVAVASGFHSRVERECLEILLAGMQPVLLSPARGIERIRLDASHRKALESGRMLILSVHGGTVLRPSGSSSERRNRVVAALADRVFIAGASAGGRLHALAREVSARAQPLSCFDHPSNRDLLLMGATGVPVR